MLEVVMIVLEIKTDFQLFLFSSDTGQHWSELRAEEILSGKA
jgi:hypothetical protein